MIEEAEHCREKEKEIAQQVVMAEAENVRLLTQVEELQGQVKKEGEVVPSETVPSASEKNVEARQE